MSEIFDSIKRGLKGAIAHQSGGTKGMKTHIPSEIDVQALRTRIGLTQEQFAAKFDQPRDPAALGAWRQEAPRACPRAVACDR